MPDWDAVAAAVDAMRELARTLVAGLIADGFTDEQAHAIATTMITNRPTS